MSIESKLSEIVKDVLVNYQNVFLVQTSHKQDLHEIVIDGDELLGIYDISAISREINNKADEKMPDEKYSLEVASPGADATLLLLRQYPKHIGREFKVILIDGREFTGKLISVKDETLSFEHFKSVKPKKNETPETSFVKHSDIKKANIILSFK